MTASAPWSDPILPHAGRMRWIQRARLSGDGRSVLAQARVGGDFPFLRGGFLEPPALIELLAQAAATGSAMQAGASGRRIRQGVLAAIRELTIHAAVPAGSTLDLIAVHEKTFGPLAQTSLEVRLNGALIARARMTFHLTFE